MPADSPRHFWIGKFPSDVARGVYFDENSEFDIDIEDSYLSQFAQDQGEQFYDHDWIEMSSFKPEELESTVKEHSYSEVWYSKVMDLMAQVPDTDFDTFVMIDAREIAEPRTVDKPNMKLYFLGTV